MAELLNYCLGGGSVRTPAVVSELISTQLEGTIGDTRVLIERSLDARTSVELSWESSDGFARGTFPIQAGQHPVYEDEVYNFSDFVLKCIGLPILRVRKRKRDPESDLWRVSLRDFFEFCSLDPRNLDSRFFLLETADSCREEQGRLALCFRFS